MTYDPAQAEQEIRELRAALEQARRELATERDLTDRQNHVLKLLTDERIISTSTPELLDEVMADYRNMRTPNAIQ